MAASNSTPVGWRAFSVAELIAALLVLLVIWFAGKILLMAFAGLVVGVFLYTLANWVSDYTPLSYGWALAAVVVMMAVFTAAGFSLVGTRLTIQANQFAAAVPSGLKQVEDELSQTPWGKWVMEQSPGWGKALAAGSIPSRITDLGSSIVDLVVTFIIILFVGLYGAAEPRLYAEGVLRLVSLDKRDRARQVMSTVTYNLRWWILGQMFAMICVGIITGTGLAIVGAPLAMTLGVLAAALEIIPNVGPVLWVVPAALVAMPEGPRMVMNVVIIYAVTHMIESYVLVPMVQRRTVLLPPALSILAAVLLGMLAGLLGLIVAAPIALVGMLLVKMLYVEDRLGDHGVRVPGEPNH